MADAYARRDLSGDRGRGREENSFGAEVPKVLGNLLKGYAGTHYEYDAHGNLAMKTSPCGQQRYEWDGFDRLVQADVAETGRRHQARYFYVAFNRRIAKEVDGDQTVFGWDGDRLAFETTSADSTHYLYEADTFVPLAQYRGAVVAGIETPVWHPDDRYVPENDPLMQPPAARGDVAVYYYQCDQIGTPQYLSDGKGDIAVEMSYKAWGEAREVISEAAKAAGITNPLRFQGQYFDAETGVHYNRYRYYDPQAGRFISKDPIGLVVGVNGYQYAPNPTAWVDPLGLTSACCTCLYRGVSAKHPARAEAEGGVVRAAKPSANISPNEHAEGGSTGESQYVSWTPIKDLALYHANKDGPVGVLLSVPRGAPTDGDSWAWGWPHVNDWGETEMLQTGTRTGVHVSKEGCL